MTEKIKKKEDTKKFKEKEIKKTEVTAETEDT